MNFPGKSVIKKKRVVDVDILSCLDLHGFKDVRKLRAFLVLCELRMKYITPDNPNPEIFIETEQLQYELGLSKWILNQFKIDLEKRELIKRARRHLRIDDQWCGSRTHIQITEKGLALYWKIKSSMNGNQPVKPKKAPVLKYTDQDMENAKFWFRNLRKYWRESPGKLKQIGAWEKQKEARANAARIAREKLGITAEEFEAILRQICECNDAEFYFKNILGPNTFNKKWKNGLTAAESMRTHCEELNKEKQNQDKLTISRQDVPVYENGEENEDVSKYWDAMWDTIGNRLRTKFKNEADCNDYLDTLYAVCDNLEDIVSNTSVQPGQINLKDSGLRRDLAASDEPDHTSYFFWLLDKYSGWNGLFSRQMLIEPWMEFWRRVWKINHGEPTEQDMEQFKLNIDMPA